jgi:gag-polypeptide of LTR copia-type
MTSALETSPFLFVQRVNNDPAAILRILDTKYQGTDTSSVMSAVKEFTIKKYRPGQHMEMFVAEFEGLAMRLEAIGHGVSEQMRVVNFLNSLSEVSALSAVLSVLRVINNFSWTKSTTQILLESELKVVNNKGPERPERAMFANNGFTGTCIHAARLVIAARTTLIVDVTRAVIPWVVIEGTVENVTLIVAKEVVTLTIVKVTEVRSQEVRAKEARAKEERETKKASMDVAVKEVTSIVSDSQMMATTILRHARAPPAIGYRHSDQFNRAKSSSDDDQFDRAASAIVAAYHIDKKLHSQTVVVDSGAMWHMSYDFSVSHKLESIAPTTVKLDDDSTTNCTQIVGCAPHV